MVNIYDVNQQELVERAAEELKKVKAIEPPEWAAYVKTGVGRERPPANDDWWYHRSASILKTVCKLGPIGVNKLRTKYGGKKRRGMQPPIFALGSGNIIRKSLQQLEKAGFIKHNEKGVHKGKTITPQGKLFLERIAVDIVKNPKVIKEKEARVEGPKSAMPVRQDSKAKPDKERKYPKKEGEKSEFSK